MEKTLLLILIVIAAFIISYPLIILRRKISEKDIIKWANANKLEIIKIEEKEFVTPFPYFSRSRGQKVFKVTTRNINNEIKTAWLKLGNFWLGFLKPEVVCKWENN